MTNEMLNSKIEELRALEVAAAEISKKVDAIKTELKAELDAQKADSINTGLHKMFYTAYQKSSVDSAKLKEAGLFDQFSKLITVLQFKAIVEQ